MAESMTSEQHAEYMEAQNAAKQAANAPVNVVYLGGIGRFACWWFVILSILGIVVGFISIVSHS